MRQTVGASPLRAGQGLGPGQSLPVLDTMRAIAAIAVLATHAAFWGGAYTQSFWGPALARLDVGVPVFFVLSGFLLSRPYWDSARRGTPGPRVGSYLYHRALRIVPVYLIAVVVAMLVLPGNQGATLGHWARTLLMLNIYTDEQLPDGLTQMWSLGTEVAFYLALPLLMLMLVSRRSDGAARARRYGLVAAVLLAANLGWLLVLVPRLDGAPGLPGVWLPAYLTWFGVGLLLAAAQVHLSGTTSSSERTLAHALRDLGRSPGVCWTAALALFAIASTPIAGPYTLTPATLGEATAKNLLYAAIAGLVILPAVFADPAGRFHAVMSRPGLRHLGHISYGVFCLHLVVLELVARWRGMELFTGRTAELFVLTLAGSLLLAEVTYRLVEKPLTALRRHPRERAERPASAPA